MQLRYRHNNVQMNIEAKQRLICTTTDSIITSVGSLLVTPRACARDKVIGRGVVVIVVVVVVVVVVHKNCQILGFRHLSNSKV